MSKVIKSHRTFRKDNVIMNTIYSFPQPENEKVIARVHMAGEKEINAPTTT